MIPRLVVIHCNVRRKWTHAIRHDVLGKLWACSACGERVRVVW